MNRYLLCALIVPITLLAGGCALLSPAPEFKGALYAAPAAPPDFSLPSTGGGNFTLSEQRGTVTLVFFGYTSCPDVCPQTLGVVRSALGQLDQEEKEQVRLVMISVDPGRDRLPVLEGYLARFDPSFVGVRPTDAELEQLAADYAMFAEAEPADPETGVYLVSHTSLVYVIDKAGLLRLGFFSGMSAEDMAHDLSILAGE